MNDNLQESVKERGRDRKKFRNSKQNPFRTCKQEDLPMSESLQLLSRAHISGAQIRSSPLRRWLYKQVGRKWDDVYSDIAGVAKFTDHVHNLRKIVKWFVATDAVIIDGVPSVACGGTSSTGFRPVDLAWSRRPALYVHPISGLLLVHKSPKQEVKPAPTEFILITQLTSGWSSAFHNAGRVGYRKIDGIWYLVREYYDKSYRPTPREWKYSINLSLTTVSKKQLNGKELRNLGLVNEPGV